VNTTLASPGNDRYVLALAVLFALEWVALAISPRYRQDWALENALTVAFVAGLVLLRDEWAKALTGRSIGDVFGWQRNYYDRLVHFSYGFLFAYPIREILMRFAGARGIWSYYLPVAIASSTSLDYEVIEWGAASLFGGELGVAYLGTQGDVWDAQKDMILAVLGAILSVALLAIGNTLRRDA
jgi:putative membrane protein